MAVKTPDQPEFYQRDAVHLAKELPGELVVTEASIHVITQTEAFCGLIRQRMQQDYDLREREPGDVCITNFRGWPQVNVVGKGPQGKPQLTWLKSMMHGSDTVANAGLIRGIADSRQEKVGNNELFDFAVDNLDGTSVLNDTSPLCIVRNSLEPLADRRINFKEHAGSADNSGGIATLGGLSTSVDSRAWLQAVVQREAQRLGVTVEDIGNPSKAGAIVKRSPLLARILAQLANSAGR